MLNRSAPRGAVVPSVCYRDTSEAATWLCDAFGFREHLRWGPPSSPTIELVLGDAAIFVRNPGRGHGTAQDLEFGPPSGTLHCSLMVDVADVDIHHQRAALHDAEVVLGPETYPFGERQYSVLDLAGHLWTFTQSVADVDPRGWASSVTSVD